MAAPPVGQAGAIRFTIRFITRYEVRIRLA